MKLLNLKPIAFIVDWWCSAVETDAVLKDYRSFKDFENSVHGFASTPSTDYSTDICESISSSNRWSLQHNDFKLALKELNMFGSCQFQIPVGEIEWHCITAENLGDVFKNATDLEINVGFLWAAFLKRSDLFCTFLQIGAQTSFYEHTYGLSALHLAAYSGCKQGTKYLLPQKGCYINVMYKCYSPLHCAAFGNSTEVAAMLLDNGANIDGFTNDPHCYLEGVLHCAVRANAVSCLKLFCEKGGNINQLDSAGRTPVHLAAELGHAECLRVLVEAKGANINQQTKEKQQTALHFAAQKRHPSCIDVLLNHGASPHLLDFKQHTPLHVAAMSQCNDCLKMLLKKGKSNPNLQDVDQRTALHLTVSKSGRANFSDGIKTLLRYGADINAKDSQRYTPLHLAARHELSECVETLILYDANITAKCKSGITALKLICQKTPTSINAIRKKLDDSVVFSHHDQNSKEFELQIDFSVILQYCHPKEITFLNTLLDEGQNELLLHPVCTAFLHLKWNKVRKFFIFKALCCFLLVITMSAYVLMGLSRYCYNFSKNVTVASYEEDKDLCLNHSLSGLLISKHPYIIEIEWYFMMFLTVAIIIRKLCGIPGYSSIVEYVCNLENVLDWSSIAIVYLISFAYTGKTYMWQNHVSAFGVLITWTNFLYILGQFPFFGIYIAMYSSVQEEFAKLLLVFSCLLVGFTVSFCVLFPKSELFSSIYIGFITVLTMAIGEMNFDLVTDSSETNTSFWLPGSIEIIYTTFITCVTIILLNLLVGITVHDIQGLKKTANLAKLRKETKLISFIEKAIFTDNFFKKVFFGVLRWRTLVSSTGYCVLKIKLHNQKEKILPLDILDSAYQVAQKHKKKNKNNVQKIMLYNTQKSFSKNQFKKSDKCDERRIEDDLSYLKNEVQNLNNEVLNMKNVLESNQKLMEQILHGLKYTFKLNSKRNSF